MARPLGRPDYAALVAMLQYRRPHGSNSERDFIRRFITSLGAECDEVGNRYLTVGKDPTIMWSAHTDSVHKMGGKQRISRKDNILKLHKQEKVSNCLGADNAAGVWMLREMILAGVPGLYVFHRQEETGGVGSSHFAKHNLHLLAGIKASIAFDRRNTKSIITHQGWGMTASDAFAKSLASAIGMGHKPDDTGIFTDTANYSDVISECSNISAGFFSEHSANETLDAQYLLDLRDAMISADLSSLVFEREPGDDGYSKSFRDPYSRFSSVWDDDDDWPLTSGTQFNRLRELCRTRADDVADFLEMNGVTAEEVEDHIVRSLGYSEWVEKKLSKEEIKESAR
jgi:hypothetical protein